MRAHTSDASILGHDAIRTPHTVNGNTREGWVTTARRKEVALHQNASVRQNTMMTGIGLEYEDSSGYGKASITFRQLDTPRQITLSRVEDLTKLSRGFTVWCTTG